MLHNLLLLMIEMDSMRKQSELDKKSYDDLVRERDILSKVRQNHAIFPYIIYVECQVWSHTQ